MAGLNKVMLIGRLGADPEARSLNNGGEVVNVRIATSETWKDRDGNRQERTEWHSVVCFNEHLGKVIKDYARKGDMIYVEGALQTRKWTDQSGADRYSTEVVMQKFNGAVVLLGGKPDGERSSGGGSRGGKPQQDDDGFGFGDPPAGGRQREERSRPQPAAFDTDLDDDVPF
jgi:single-strand DNA-binding protein